VIFFGFGSKSKMATIDGVIVVLRYRYIHIMWLFQIAYGLTYFWRFSTPQGPYERQITPQELADHHIKERLHLNFWWQWGLLAIPALVVLAAIVTFVGGFIQGN